MKNLYTSLSIVLILLIGVIAVFYTSPNTGLVITPCPELTCPRGETAKTISFGKPKECVCGSFTIMQGREIFLYDNRDVKIFT